MSDVYIILTLSLTCPQMLFLDFFIAKIMIMIFKPIIEAHATAGSINYFFNFFILLFSALSFWTLLQVFVKFIFHLSKIIW